MDLQPTDLSEKLTNLKVFQLKDLIEKYNEKYPDNTITKYKAKRKSELVNLLISKINSLMGYTIVQNNPAEKKSANILHKYSAKPFNELQQEEFLQSLDEAPRYANPLQALQKYTTKEGTKEYIQLQQHQANFIKQFIFSNLRGAIAFHGVGSGKTLTAVVSSYYYLKMYPNNKVIVISPSALLYNFINGMIQYGLDIRDNRYSFYTYEKYIRSPKIARDALLIVDEAHNFRTEMGLKEIRDPNNDTVVETVVSANRRGYIVKKFGSDYSHKIILLTGTAFVNKIYDIENLLAMVDNRAPISSDAFNTLISDITNLPDYFSYKISYYPSIESEFFPDRRERLEGIYMDANFLRKYNDIANSKGANLVGYAAEHFAGRKLKQSKRGETYGLEAYYNGLLNATNSIGGVDNPKIKYICDLIEDKYDEKFIVYSKLDEAGIKLLLKRLYEMGIGVGLITGSQSTSKKEASKKYFNFYNFGDKNFFGDNVDPIDKKFINDKFRVLLITRAGAEGVDTINCNNIVLLDSQWHDALSEQIIARAIRFKSHFGLPKNKRYVNVIRVLMLKPSDRGTFEKITSPDFSDWTFIKNDFDEEREARAEIKRAEKELGMGVTVALKSVKELPTFNEAEYKALKDKAEKSKYKSRALVNAKSDLVNRTALVSKGVAEEYKMPTNWEDVYKQLRKRRRQGYGQKSLPPVPIPYYEDVINLPNFNKSVYDALTETGQREIYRYYTNELYKRSLDVLNKTTASSFTVGTEFPSIDLYLLVLAKAKTVNMEQFVSTFGNDISLFEEYESKLLPFVIEAEKSLKRPLTDEEQAKIYAKLLNEHDQETIKLIPDIQNVLKEKKTEREKQEKLQQYFTGIELTNELIGLTSIKKNKQKITILEPTAGWGNLIKPLLQMKKDITIDMVEYDKSNREVLEKLVDETPILRLMEQPDFLKFIPSSRYDYILMNPPFHLRKSEIPFLISDTYDYDFVKRAYACLKVGGELIAITGHSWRKDREFEQWANSVGWEHFDKKGEKFYHNGKKVTPPITIMKFYKKTNADDDKIFNINFYRDGQTAIADALANNDISFDEVYKSEKK